MRQPKLILLLIPGVIFLLVLVLIISKLPKTAPNKTEVPAALETPIPSSTPPPTGHTPIQLYLQSVNDLQISDPQLAAPNFDRKISLPIEK